MKRLRRGELYVAELPDDDAKPPEFSDGNRREHIWVVVSTNRLARAGYVLAAPTTTQQKSNANLDEFRVVVRPDQIETTPQDRPPTKDAVVLCDQVRAMSATRFDASQRCGRLMASPQGEVDLALLRVLGLRPGQ